MHKAIKPAGIRPGTIMGFAKYINKYQMVGPHLGQFYQPYRDSYV